MSITFPNTPAFTGFNEPRRVEAVVDNLCVTGTIPASLQGAVYRNGPDPRLPPLLGDDINWNGDGLVTCWRFDRGHVDFRCRYVRTEKFNLESAARRALFGAYRNPFTDDPSVAGKDRTTANTSVYLHGGRMLAVKEDGLPYELDPLTLETRGRHTYQGRIRSQTTTAHPKRDPVTGELFGLGYEALGPATTDVAIQTVAADGQLTNEQFVKLPHVSFIHDWGVTADYFIIPAMPTTTSIEWMQAKKHFRWVHDASRETLFGVVRRGAPIETIRWFRGPASGGGGHFMNAFNVGDRVYLDGFHSVGCQFPYVSNADGSPFDRQKSTPILSRWSFDLSSNSDRFSVEPIIPNEFMEMPVIDGRFETRGYRYGFAVVLDRTRQSIVQGTLGLGWNTLVRVDLQQRVMDRYFVGDHTTCQEPIFVPRSAQAGEADGWLLSVLTRDTGAGVVTELIILDTQRLSAGPVATIHMPFRLHAQTHGCWVSDEQLSRTKTPMVKG